MRAMIWLFVAFELAAAAAATCTRWTSGSSRNRSFEVSGSADTSAAAQYAKECYQLDRGSGVHGILLRLAVLAGSAFGVGLFPDESYPYDRWSATKLSYEVTFGAYGNSRLSLRKSDTGAEIWSSSAAEFQLSATQWRLFEMELNISGPAAGGKFAFRRLSSNLWPIVAN